MVIDKELEKEIINMYVEQRMSGDKIAKQLGINRCHIYKIIKNNNIARNNGGIRLKDSA